MAGDRDSDGQNLYVFKIKILVFLVLVLRLSSCARRGAASLLAIPRTCSHVGADGASALGGCLKIHNTMIHILKLTGHP